MSLKSKDRNSKLLLLTCYWVTSHMDNILGLFWVMLDRYAYSVKANDSSGNNRKVQQQTKDW